MCTERTYINFSLSPATLETMLVSNDLIKFQYSRGSPSKIANSFFGKPNSCFMVNAILSINSSGKIYSFSESEEAVLDLAARPLNSRALGFSCDYEPLDSVDFCPPLGSRSSCLYPLVEGPQQGFSNPAFPPFFLLNPAIPLYFTPESRSHPIF